MTNQTTDKSQSATSTTTATLDAAPSSQALTGFGLSLFKTEAKGAIGKNVLISPASVAIALAMTMNGARAATLGAMRTTLGYGDLDISAINASAQALIATLTDPESGVELNVANAIWAEQSVKFKDEFFQSVKSAYSATVNNSDFSSPATVDAINAWADSETRGKIPTIIDSIAPDMVMFLLNAIYFKGKWTTCFEPESTRDSNFTDEGGAASMVPFMWRNGDMRYNRGSDYQAVVLPFGESERVGLYVIVPEAGVDVNSLIGSLDATTLGAIGAARKTEVSLSLPRFELDYDVDLKDSLAELGMGQAFAGADFTGMADTDLAISTVKHKTFARFDEEGGEAAAVTAVGVTTESVRMTPYVVANRPFVIALVEEKSGALLFAGKVAQVGSE